MSTIILTCLIVLVTFPASRSQPVAGISCYEQIRKLAKYDEILSDRLWRKIDYANEGVSEGEWLQMLEDHIAYGEGQFGCGMTASWVSEVFQGIEGQYDEYAQGTNSIYKTGGAASGYVEMNGLDLLSHFDNLRDSNNTILYKIQLTGGLDQVWVIEQLPNVGGYRVYQGLDWFYPLNGWMTLYGGRPVETVVASIIEQGKIDTGDLFRNVIRPNVDIMSLGCGGCDIWGDPDTNVPLALPTLIGIGSFPEYSANYSAELAGFIKYARDYDATEAARVFTTAFNSYGHGILLDDEKFFLDYLNKLSTESARWDTLSGTTDIWTAAATSGYEELFGGPTKAYYTGYPFSLPADMQFATTSVNLLEIKTIELGDDPQATADACYSNARKLYTSSQIPCQFSDYVLDSFIKGHACNYDGTLQTTYDGAVEKCCGCRECTGITFDGALYSARTGDTLVKSYTGERSWIRNPEYEPVCDYETPAPIAYLSGYACEDGKKYDDLEVAQERCCLCGECSGVTCTRNGDCTIRKGTELKTSPHSETSHQKSSAVVVVVPSCPFDAPVPDSYLSGNACGKGERFASLERAQAECCDCGAACKGVTCDTDNKCTLRDGVSLKTSPWGETSYKKSGLPQPSCSFGTGVTHSYLADYACGDKTRYPTVEDAQHACCECDECFGVTTTLAGKSTIRMGGTTKTSKTAETSYLVET